VQEDARFSGQLADRHRAVHRWSGVCCLSGGRRLLRLLSGTEGCATGSHRSAALRITTAACGLAADYAKPQAATWGDDTVADPRFRAR
jgi:hypothetical protein